MPQFDLKITASKSSCSYTEGEWRQCCPTSTHTHTHSIHCCPTSTHTHTHSIHCCPTSTHTLHPLLPHINTHTHSIHCCPTSTHAHTYSSSLRLSKPLYQMLSSSQNFPFKEGKTKLQFENYKKEKEKKRQ